MINDWHHTGVAPGIRRETGFLSAWVFRALEFEQGFSRGLCELDDRKPGIPVSDILLD